VGYCTVVAVVVVVVVVAVVVVVVAAAAAVLTHRWDRADHWKAIGSVRHQPVEFVGGFNSSSNRDHLGEPHTGICPVSLCESKLGCDTRVNLCPRFCCCFGSVFWAPHVDR
jgi:hypothetical protein